MEILEAINWMDLLLMTSINLIIGFSIGWAFAAWDTRRNVNVINERTKDLEKFRAEYTLAQARVRSANDQLVRNRGTRK